MRTRITLAFTFFYIFCQSQPAYQFVITAITEECYLGSASLAITGLHPKDTVNTEWSTGERNVMTIKNLVSGSYFVRTSIRHWEDSVLYVKDTTLYYIIEKETCPVSIPRYFSPNSDGYNDHLTVGNADKHPNFEFCVYNKWGQKVHGQKKQFFPWDGTWNGLALPDGVYYYIFFFDASNKDNIVKGDITILR